MRYILRCLLVAWVGLVVSGCTSSDTVEKPANPAPPPKEGPKSYNTTGSPVKKTN